MDQYQEEPFVPFADEILHSNDAIKIMLSQLQTEADKNKLLEE